MHKQTWEQYLDMLFNALAESLEALMHNPDLTDDILVVYDTPKPAID